MEEKLLGGPCIRWIEYTEHLRASQRIQCDLMD